MKLIIINDNIQSLRMLPAASISDAELKNINLSQVVTKLAPFIGFQYFTVGAYLQKYLWELNECTPEQVDAFSEKN